MRLNFFLAIAVAFFLAAGLAVASEPIPPEFEPAQSHMEMHLLDRQLTDLENPERSAVPEPEHREECVGGVAGGFPCNRVDLLELMPMASIGGGNGNDIWGWTDPLDGKEYALMGRTNGTAFIDISDPEEAIYLGNLATHTGNSTWRDIKVHSNHAFIVSEAGGHGMQIFDLTQLRSVPSPPATFSNTAHYSGFGNAHNIVINEDSGFAYAVGTDTCSGGLHMVDISTPTSPVSAGCFSDDGYTHDAQCVNYVGPDTDYAGAEVCFNSNTDTLTIVDVTNKSTPVQISRTGYSGVGYTHQGWVTDDHQYFILDDEVDEINTGDNTRTLVWDLADLDNPTVIGSWDSGSPATDHNLYVHNGLVWEANYRAGLRILTLDDVANGNLSEVAFFDTFPSSNAVGTSDGAWSVYPYFDSGVAIISTQREGMFIVEPILCEDPATPDTLAASAAGDNAIGLSWNSTAPPEATFDVYRSFGACPGGTFERIAEGLTGTTFSDTTVSGQVDYSYVVRASVEEGLCVSPDSNCSSVSTTGACSAPPIFSGVQSVTNLGTSGCALDVAWDSASANCGGPVTYSVYRSTVAGFTPAPGNRVAQGLQVTHFVDTSVTFDQDYYYVVRSSDTANSVEDGNSVELSGSPAGPPANGLFDTGAEIGDPTVIYDTGALTGDPESVSNLLHIGWEPATDRSNTGDRSFFSTYENNVCIWFATHPLSLTAGEASQLSFWTVYFTEDRWDGGVVQVSTDGGSNWNLLALDQGYPNTFRQSTDACGFATNSPSFSGVNLTWTQYTADLSTFNGQDLQIRWIFSTDGAQTEEGWYVDDIQLTNVSVPGQCTNTDIFADGFETGDSSAWSLTFP